MTKEDLENICKYFFETGQFELRNLEALDFHVVGRITELDSVGMKNLKHVADDSRECLQIYFRR